MGLQQQIYLGWADSLPGASSIVPVQFARQGRFEAHRDNRLPEVADRLQASAGKIPRTTTPVIVVR
jgi:surfactin synthase thioesterase subunit